MLREHMITMLQTSVVFLILTNAATLVAAVYALRRSGPMTMAPSQLGAFVRSDPSRDTPNLQYHIQPLTLPKFGEPLDPFPAFTASVANVRPTSRGSVRISAAAVAV